VRNDVYDATIATQHQALGVPEETLWVDRLGYTPEQAESFKDAAMQRRAEEIGQVVAAMRTAPPQNVGQKEEGSPEGG